MFCWCQKWANFNNTFFNTRILEEGLHFVIFKFDTNKSKNTILMVCLKMKCFANTKVSTKIEDWWYGVDIPDKTNGVWSMDSCARTNQIKLLMNGLPPSPGILVVIFNKISYLKLIEITLMVWKDNLDCFFKIH